MRLQRVVASKFQKQSPLIFAISAATSGPTSSAIAHVSHAEYAAWGGNMGHGGHFALCHPSFSRGQAKISASRYMNQLKRSPLPNLSFNPDPTVRDYLHALNIRSTVGPVNFVR